MAAINAWWDERRRFVEELFQPQTPPLERIGGYISWVVERQLQVYSETGQVLGCPLFTLGSEISTQDERLCTLVRDIMTAGENRFESAIRDAQAAGEIDSSDAMLKARSFGLSMRAR